jgi:hypothetical protein
MTKQNTTSVKYLQQYIFSGDQHKKCNVFYNSNQYAEYTTMTKQITSSQNKFTKSRLLHNIVVVAVAQLIS